MSGRSKRSELAGMPLPGKRLLSGGRKGHYTKGHRGPGRYKLPDANRQAANSGVILSSGRNNGWRGDYGHELRHYKRKGHYGRHAAGGPQIIDARSFTRIDNSVAIAVVAGALAAQEQADAPGARIEEACEAGAYCVVRLGPYTNSPKIITLNKTGAQVDPAVTK